MRTDLVCTPASSNCTSSSSSQHRLLTSHRTTMLYQPRPDVTTAEAIEATPLPPSSRLVRFSQWAAKLGSLVPLYMC